MATNNPLQSVVVTSPVSSITFSGISQDYTDLLITADFTISVANASVFMRFNGDTSTSFSDTTISGTGANRYTDRDENQTQIRVSAQRTAQTATDRQHFTININDYANTTHYKTCLSRYGSIGGVEGYAGQWRKTSAINSITFGFADAYTFSPGTTISLYGIKSGAPKMLGGDVVVTDGTYWYHAFTSTGSVTTTAQSPVSADILVVAGGGGGGADGGGGGGAGGVLAFASETLTGNYTVLVGAGGSGSAAASATNTSGTNSQFGSLTASVGGGKGASYGVVNGTNGGSGGGSGETGGTAGQPTSGQGSAGGTNLIATSAAGGGGKGGAGASATVGTSGANGGAGGAGTTNVTNWGTLTSALTATGLGVSNYLAGGGGGGGHSTSSTLNAGGPGGSGGGGRGGNYSNSTAGRVTTIAGTVNTGSGGGGDGWFAQGGKAGGSGVVIVRYAV